MLPGRALCRGHQRGVAALEFALVMPSVIALFLGIGTFGAALYAKQLLYDVAGETARACVLKSLGSTDAITSCVSSVGSYLSSSQVHQQICLGSPVSFSAALATSNGGQTIVPASYPQQILALRVTASCAWNFAPGFIGLLGGLTAPPSLSATASMPVLYDTSPL
ncbi:hypothetical protein Q3G72_021566 [Acer saccharum]|nr:hypothetical protein Q3G72_021566 [Acer saccharum]